MSQTGNIFNIQRYTIHDGPGIRTELFLKGCPLRCKWCSNPESHLYHSQPGVYTSKCIGQDKCGLCIESCPHKDSLLFQEEKLIGINRDLCINCMKCATACPADAIKTWGNTLTVEDAMEMIRKDNSYYETSGGGVTLSGGEPLQQVPFVKELLQHCQKEQIHTCVETTFCMDWQKIQEVLPYTDLFITDIKHMDSNIHKTYTGISNHIILENIKKIAVEGKPLIIRIPVIPDVNDTMDNMEATADYICHQLDNSILQLQLLHFMRLGEEKYQSLNVPYPMKDMDIDREAFDKKLHGFADYFTTRGIPCIVGTTT